MLQDCLRQVVPEESSSVGGEGESQDGAETKDIPSKEKQIEKIRIMLDTSKAQMELKELKLVKENLDGCLKMEQDLRQQLQGGVEHMC
jgi:hypothetical protein